MIGFVMKRVSLCTYPFMCHPGRSETKEFFPGRDLCACSNESDLGSLAEADLTNPESLDCTGKIGPAFAVEADATCPPFNDSCLTGGIDAFSSDTASAFELGALCSVGHTPWLTCCGERNPRFACCGERAESGVPTKTPFVLPYNLVERAPVAVELEEAAMLELIIAAPTAPFAVMLLPAY